MEPLQFNEVMEINSLAAVISPDLPIRIKNPSVIRETLRPCCIGHTFTKQDIPPDPVQYIVQDFLVDSSGISKGGDPMEPILQVGLNEAKRAEYIITAGPCKEKFEVALPKAPQGYFSSYLGRQSLHPTSGFYDAYPAHIIFNGLIGASPIITYAFFFIQNGKNDAYHFVIEGNFSGNFSFNSITIYATYPARNFIPKVAFYKPLSYAAPFGLGTTACYFLFGYNSLSGVDEGQVVEII